LAVRAEFERVHLLTVAFVGEDAAFSSRVPQLQVGVRAARGQEVPVGVKVHGGGSCSVSSQCANESAGNYIFSKPVKRLIS